MRTALSAAVLVLRDARAAACTPRARPPARRPTPASRRRRTWCSPTRTCCSASCPTACATPSPARAACPRPPSTSISAPAAATRPTPSAAPPTSSSTWPSPARRTSRPERVLPQFEAIGVALGRDQNAQTGLLRHHLQPRHPQLRRRQVRPGVQLAARRRRRPYHRAGGSGPRARHHPVGISREPEPGSAIAKQATEFMLPELARLAPAAHRHAGDDPPATPASIRGFYEKWYRPEVAILIVVSDQPGDVVQANASSRRSAPGARRRPSPTKPDLGHVNIEPGLRRRRPHSDPNIAEPAAGLPRHGQGSRSTSRTSASTCATWRTRPGARSCEKRLDRLSESANPPIAAGEVDRTRYLRRRLARLRRDRRAQRRLATAPCTPRRPRPGAWSSMASPPMRWTARPAELRAKLTAGPGRRQQHDPEGARRPDARQLPARRHHRHASRKTTASSRARSIELNARADRRRIPPGLDAAPTARWSCWSRPSRRRRTDVRKAWLDAEAEPKPAPPDRRGCAIPGPIPTSGRRARSPAARRSPTSARRASQFANGVRVNFKSLDNMPDKVFIRIRFGAGQQELRAVAGLRRAAGALMLRAGGLGKNDFAGHRRALRDPCLRHQPAASTATASSWTARRASPTSTPSCSS